MTLLVVVAILVSLITFVAMHEIKFKTLSWDTRVYLFGLNRRFLHCSFPRLGGHKLIARMQRLLFKYVKDVRVDVLLLFTLLSLSFYRRHFLLRFLVTPNLTLAHVLVVASFIGHFVNDYISNSA